MTTLAIILAVIFGLQFLTYVTTYFTVTIDAPAFMAQIQKLVMAQSIDRAIKLCNSIPNNLLSKKTKALLVLSRRPYAIEVEYQEALLDYSRVLGHVNRAFLYVQPALLAFGVLSLIYGPGSSGVEIPIYIAGGFFLVNAVFWGKLVLNINLQAANLHKIRTLLYGHQEYTPPQYKPQKMTADEIKAWRESLQAFEADLTERRKNGESFKAEEEYEKKAGPDGVLPPI